MPVRLESVSFDAMEPTRLAAFWAELLQRDAYADEEGGVLLPGDATQIGLRFAPNPQPKDRLNRIHLHLTSDHEGDQQATVTEAVRLGARHLDVGQRPEELHIVLADPEGNEFCVIEAGNRYLADCGFLGEAACDGTRDVGLFWSAALSWPLVWDQDEETAIQSPAGGTKVAWGGPPVTPPAEGRQHFVLAAVDASLEAEVDRLVSLGATRLGPAEWDAVALSDPDGNRFVVRRAT
jgi:hypothetical protein